MECILGCNSLSLKNSAVERVRYSSTRIWNVFLDRNYLLLRNSAGESQIQFHRERESALDCNYLFFEELLWGESQIQFHRDMECILTVIISLLKAPLGRESNTVPQGYGIYF